MKEKFIKKFMLLAKTVAKDNNVCYSRKIGVVVVDPNTNGVVSIGYNGPPENTPHTDSLNYITNFLWPQLTANEKYTLIIQHCHALNTDEKEVLRSICNSHGVLERPHSHNVLSEFEMWVALKIEGCKTCPRKLLGYKSGERSDLCSCQHAERNALNKLPIPARGLVMFCWCGVPCIQCAGSIINANISEVHCFEDTDYHPVSRFLFETSKTKLFEYPKQSFV